MIDDRAGKTPQQIVEELHLLPPPPPPPPCEGDSSFCKQNQRQNSAVLPFRRRLVRVTVTDACFRHRQRHAMTADVTTAADGGWVRVFACVNNYAEEVSLTFV